MLPTGHAQHTELLTYGTDGIGDVAEPRGDIGNAVAGLLPGGQAAVGIQVVRYESPFSPNWANGETYALWKLRVNDNVQATYYVQMFNVAGLVYAVVTNAAGQFVCDNDGVFWDAATRSYEVDFATSCVNDPNWMVWSVTMFYENVSTGARSEDHGPDQGEYYQVRNDSFVQPPNCRAGSLGTTPTPSAEYVAVTPVRLYDSRPTGNSVDCQAQRYGLRGAGSVTEVPVTRRAGVPVGATAAVLNLTVTDARSAGFIAVVPCGGTRGEVSNLNYVEGSTVANAVVAQLSPIGSVCLFSYGSTHLIVDLAGWFPAASHFAAATPARLVDTRNLATPADPDAGLVQAGQVARVHVAGAGGVAADAAAVVLNVTAVDARQPGFLTAYPCGSARPNASNLNYLVGDNVPGLAVVRPEPATGDVCLFAYGTTHLVVDLQGWFPAAAGFTSSAPQRILDTRPAALFGTTVDGESAGIGRRAAGQVTVLQVAGRAGVPAGATAVALNLTVDQAAAPGFVAAFPCGGDRPDVSNVNYETGATVANAAIVRVAPDGTVCLFTYSPTELVADVSGYFTS
ncbi:MAG: hypothetical protein JWM12_3701 [Ilumatobacteraceae bacterium]|nr:hypothetical protein [Ilumatobacteraceae bacterium]